MIKTPCVDKRYEAIQDKAHHQTRSNQYPTLVTDSKVASGALQAFRNFSSIMPTALKHLSSASMDDFRLKSCETTHEITKCISLKEKDRCQKIEDVPQNTRPT